MTKHKSLSCTVNPSITCPILEKASKEQTRYDRILEYSFEEIYIIDAATMKFREVSKGALRNLGYTLDEMKQMIPVDIKPSISQEVFASITTPLAIGEVEIAKFSAEHHRKDGSKYNVDIRLQYVPGDDPVFIAMITDTTEQKQYEAELKALAFRDPGTDLYNRRYFLEQMEGTIHHMNRMNSSVGLIMIDMDDFSKVNNTFGHLIGDKIITVFTEKIKKVFSRKTDIVARYGGDEFVVMCINTSEEDLLKKCNELIKLFNVGYFHNGHDIIQTASVGICVRNDRKVDSEQLISGADQAMYEVKERGKNAVQICKEEKKSKTNDTD